MPSGDRMPAAFLGHGNPMNALEHNAYTEAWRRFGEACVRPTAILMVSAHWYINASALTAMPQPRTIHDFYGFPKALGEFMYPAPGSPELAGRVAELAVPDRLGLDRESWGLDHGTWSVLAHAFPNADVPVVQLSINAQKPFEYHTDLARRLAPLREQGVVIMGSGNVVHNLHRIEWDRPEDGYDWARSFDEAARDVMTRSPRDAVELRSAPEYRLAAPTPDHFIPLLYIAALADEGACPVEVLVKGYAYGSLSMTAFALDMPVAHRTGVAGPAREISAMPDPNVAPADQTNV